jgi:hypothetical protein
MAQFNDTIINVPEDKVSVFINDNKKMCIDSWEQGVLPSIKMAQAIIESASGTSEICKNANNYFGVKCHVCKNTYRGWKIFKDKKESFDYLDRLYNSKGRYGHLIGSKNIFTWATQLKECGYASSETYPQSLMYNIMLYDLYKLDSLAFKKEAMSEPNDFLLQDVSFRKDTGLNITYSSTNQEGGSLVRDTITKKSSAKSHPDLGKAQNELRIHFACIWQMLSVDLGKKSFSEMDHNEQSQVQNVLEKITITGVKFIGGDTDSKKYIIKAKVELLPGGSIGAVTPQIAEEDSRYEMSSKLAYCCEVLRDEVYEYEFNKKQAQVSMEFEMESASGASDKRPLEEA